MSGFAGLQLLINDNPVVIDGNGLFTVDNAVAGTLEGKAIAFDAAGNTSEATFDVDVVDTSDVNAPTVSFSLDVPSDGIVTAPTDIIGTISDDGDIDYYTLEVAPVAGGEFKEILKVDNPDAVTDGVLGKFDPSLLQNDSYRVRLSVYDTGGNGTFAEETVDVAGELKLGNFRLSFTDLEVPVTGIPITLTRTYDTLTSNTTDDFGYGWRMEFRDTDLRTSLGKPSEEDELLGRKPAFKDDTRVYITLPGGKREGFTFKPSIDPISGFLRGAAAGTNADPNIYRPEFEADDGVTSTLTVKDERIIRNNGTSEFFGISGSGYNPADSLFGGTYILTTKEGIEYEIDGNSGDLLKVTDTNGNTLTYTDEAVTSSTGQKITFERDASGRITSVKDPSGELIKYDYDDKGDLVSVTDREENVTRMEYNPERKHYLEKIIDPLGRDGVKTEYGEDGKLKEIIDVDGNKVELSYNLDASTQIVKDARGYSTAYTYDERGNILSESNAKGTITRTYDDDNNILTETDADGITNEYTYDDKNNLLTIEDEDENITRMTYNSRGQATSVVSPTGLKVTSKYDSRGNLLENVDSNGLKTTYKHDEKGQLRFMTAPDGQVTEYGYDELGNINRMVDSRGNEVKADYDGNGRVDKATTSFVLNGETYAQWIDYDYDDNGRVISNTNSHGNSQSTTFDALGRTKTMTDEFGNVTSYRYDLQGTSQQNNNTTTPGSVVTRIDEITMPDTTPDNNSDNPKVTRKYDQNNKLLVEISPTGLETRYVYDELGRLIETIIPDKTPDNWDDNPRIKVGYSAAGRVKSQTDIFGNEQEYDYNNLGQLTLFRDVLDNETTYTYNTGGQIESVTDPRNRKTQYVYDDKARLAQAIYFDDSRYKLTYDELGRVKTETNELDQTTTYEYDEFGIEPRYV